MRINHDAPMMPTTPYRLELLTIKYHSDIVRLCMIKQMRDLLASAPSECISHQGKIVTYKLKSPWDYHFKRMSDRLTNYVMTKYGILFMQSNTQNN